MNDVIKEAIATAPAVTRLALASPDFRQRERAAQSVASRVEHWLSDRPAYCPDAAQMTLPLA